MSKRDDEQLIVEALTHLDVLHRHLSRGDFTDEIVRDAVCMRLSAAIDALHDREPYLGERLFPDDWRKMWATRNYIAHAYVVIDIVIIRDTVENYLPTVEQVLREELARLRGE